ncbi:MULTISPECIES: ATP-dependent DNA helicase UvrD2 [Protofrankia]|uniref:DNA 3'-5' helicase n=1 Tax=Candidatus Protofrankia datiscae TaxID=2716812 RepID=F8AX76_9ACTN|nr:MULTISPECIES: ATP-dependent DNA helicase UvrD2 [Protofrankia]AEH08425.1 UvrD/REP helicase [Candidatus Protofrankia datiscae]
MVRATVDDPVSDAPFQGGAGESGQWLVEALDPEQRQAVLAPVGPVCVLAGAGTGKTRAITHRIGHLVASGAVPSGQVLAVTFTTRAAGELRGRLRTLGADGVQARTFHAAALRQLGYFWPRIAGAALPRLVESKIALVGRAASRARLAPSRTELRDLTAEIEWAKATLLTPEQYPAAATAAGRETTHPPEVIARLYTAYEQAKREAGVLDFDDLLLLTAAVIEEHGWVAEELRSRYRHFVVDEYQDVNPLQQRLLDAWLGERDSICVVGDANQTIYSFTGASPRYLLDFPRRFPEAHVVRIVRDYRSTPQVVGLANRLVARVGTAGTRGTPGGSSAPGAQGTHGVAGAVLAAARHEPPRLVAQRPDGPAPTFTEFDSEPEEAAATARRIRALLGAGVPASEIAVLYRVNAQSEAYETAIAAAGIPYLVRGGERFFERPEVAEAVQLLRAAARSADTDRPVGLVAEVTEVFAALGWRGGDPPNGSGAQRERWENLAALVRLAEALVAADPGATLDHFVADLADRAVHQHIPTVEGVTLASLHAAKGLEWDAVFLVGLAEGTLPIIHAQTPAQIEEERRLLYVGVTRARERLALSWALARHEGGRRSRRPSRFLDGLAPRSASSAGRPAGGPAHPGVDGAGALRSRGRAAVRCRVCERPLVGQAARAGRCDGCPANIDQALFERLRAWRSARAREQSAPAFVVFTDATLMAIAEHRPTSVAELVGIPGIGQAKLDRYGEDVLALVDGREPSG